LFQDGNLKPGFRSACDAGQEVTVLIQTLKPPVAGETLIVKLAGCSGKTNIEVYVGDNRLLAHEHVGLLCNLKVDVPPGTGGTNLRISANDASGVPKSLEYEISDCDPGPHSMLAGVRRDWNTPLQARKVS
jgi:hypothetical protein